jgi:hypothetical protein
MPRLAVPRPHAIIEPNRIGTDMFWNDPHGAEAILQVRPAALLCDDDHLTRHVSTRPGCAYVRRSTLISAA